ncbi:MAG TPA: chromosome segregation protein SMC [Acidobacteriota bacterium]|nr:chromosome segregation protein SMC [Acidobacteriota bacterium]
MLKFDSLEVLGFKSFAEKTRVVFSDRVSAVVGPNGCGKSNLADAIAWVLGLHTAHNLRGQRMEDLIFNGTRQRKPGGLCKVKLTVSRSGDTPLILDGEELTDDKLEIGRRLYRSGESTYLINGRRCRLMDIQRFIEESGLGFAPYALIAQGKIDSFLNARALERRSIIEEAAQISSYRSKRRSAEMKLELAQQNLVRVQDIISEVERQLRSLKRQANKARRYKDLKEEFEGLQRAKLVLESSALRKRASVLEEEFKGLLETSQKVSRELEECEAEYRRSVQLREELDTRLSELRQQRSELRLELDRATNSRRYHQEQIEAIGRQLENNARERRSIEESLAKVNEDADKLKSDLDEVKDRQVQSEQDLQERRSRLSQAEQDLEEAETEIEKLRQQLVRLSSETASLQNQQEQLEARLQSEQARGQTLEEERAKLDADIAHLEELKEQSRSRLEREENNWRQLTRQANEKRQELARLEEEMAAQESELQECQGKLIAARERLHSLQEVEMSRSQYSQGVQKLLNHLKKNGGVHSGGTLADYVETHPDFERLVEEFLDEELEYVLVDSLEDALKGVDEVRNLKSGKCTFLSLASAVQGQEGAAYSLNGLSGEEGVFGTVGEIVKMSPKVREAFDRVMAARTGAVVVTDLQRAVGLAEAHPRQTFVTLAGEALEPSGLLSASASQSKKLGLLSLKRKKREMEKKLQARQQEAESCEKRLQKSKQRLQDLALECRRLEESVHQAEKELVSRRHDLERVESDLEERRRQLGRHEQLLSEHAGQVDSMGRKLKEIRAALDQRSRQRSASEASLGERRRGLERLRQEVGQARTHLNEAHLNRQVMVERRSALDRAISRIQEQQGDLRERLRAGALAEEEGRARRTEMGQNLQQLESDLKRLAQESEQLEGVLAKSERQYQEWKRQHPEVEARLEALRERKSDLQDERSQVDIERTKVETNLENVSLQCQENLNMSLQEAASKVDQESLSLEDVLGPYQERRQKLENFGPINMTALQEYQENEERHEFLVDQRDDIERSIADTTNAIKDLNRRSREKFQEAFQAINGHFKVLFQKLFGGGDCGMRLLDEDDVLESGLDVFAQPPGKKLQHVSLLSGGEKALTGLSLLMALFQYRPSRFCILDEVDAPLDDANVLRFCKLVEEMSEVTQFIVITHNKRTMEIANALYGVTMEEAGVSKVVSVRF